MRELYINTKKIYVVDIDDTLMIYPDTFKNQESRGAQERYIDAKPDEKEIKKINTLYEKSNIILITGRGWHYYEFTKRQLKEFGIKYHEIIMGKPPGIWVDRDYKTTLKDEND